MRTAHGTRSPTAPKTLQPPAFAREPRPACTSCSACVSRRRLRAAKAHRWCGWGAGVNKDRAMWNLLLSGPLGRLRRRWASRGVVAKSDEFNAEPLRVWDDNNWSKAQEKAAELVLFSQRLKCCPIGGCVISHRSLSEVVGAGVLDHQGPFSLAWRSRWTRYRSLLCARSVCSDPGARHPLLPNHRRGGPALKRAPWPSFPTKDTQGSTPRAQECAGEWNKRVVAGR